MKAFIFSHFFLSCNIWSHRSSFLLFAATIFKIYAQKIFSQHGPYKKKLNFAVPRTPVFSARLGTAYEMGLKRQRETKKIIFNNICKSYVRGHSFMTPAKKSKGPLTASSPLSTNIGFWSKQTPLTGNLN